MSLTGLLESEGFTRIELDRSGLGHFHTSGTLNGRELSIVIDTGAASTVFSFDIAREMGLTLNKLEMLGGGAGSARMEIHEIAGAEFRLSNVVPRTRGLYAMDLSHVNEAAMMKGSGPIDAVLGVDVLEAHSAVIDYGSNSLFLRY
jgi:predicted aspartyl protease